MDVLFISFSRDERPRVITPSVRCFFISFGSRSSTPTWPEVEDKAVDRLKEALDDVLRILISPSVLLLRTRFFLSWLAFDNRPSFSFEMSFNLPLELDRSRRLDLVDVPSIETCLSLCPSVISLLNLYRSCPTSSTAPLLDFRRSSSDFPVCSRTYVCDRRSLPRLSDSPSFGGSDRFGFESNSNGLSGRRSPPPFACPYVFLDRPLLAARNVRTGSLDFGAALNFS